MLTVEREKLLALAERWESSPELLPDAAAELRRTLGDCAQEEGTRNVMLLYDIVGTAQAALIRAQSFLEHAEVEESVRYMSEAAKILREWEATREDMRLLDLHMSGIR